MIQVHKKKRNKQKVAFLSVLAFFVFTFAVVLSVVAMSSTIGEISSSVVSKSPDAILASAGVKNGEMILLPVVYYDQKEEPCVNLYDVSVKNELEKREFEWAECEYYNNAFEQGIVDYYLDDDYLPVGIGGNLVANRGTKDLSYWFREVEEKNRMYFGNLEMIYSSNGAEFSFYNKNFYPLDEAMFSKEDRVNRDGHNHLFTMHFAVPFTVLATGDEYFEIVADDDTFVFVGNELVIDMGGVHETMGGRLMINENGEIYSGVGEEELAYSGVKVDKEKDSIIRIFHADRNSSESEFSVRFRGMNLGVSNAKLADGETNNELQIAYDPSNLEFIAPLGESKVVKPDVTRGYITMATLEGVMIVIMTVFIMIVAKLIIKRKR